MKFLVDETKNENIQFCLGFQIFDNYSYFQNQGISRFKI